MIAASIAFAAVTHPAGITLFGLPDGERRRDIAAKGIAAVALSASTLAAGDAEGRVRFWDPSTGADQPFRAEPIHVGPVTHLAFSRDGRVLASAGGYRSEKFPWARYAVRVWQDGVLVRDFPSILGAPVGLAFSPDGRRLAIAGGDFVEVVDAATGTSACRGSGFGTVMEQQSDFESRTAHATCVAFAPNGRQVAVGSEDGVHALSLDTASVSPLEGEGREVGFVGFSASGRLLWRTSGEPGAAVTPDGRMLVSISGSGINVRTA